MRFGDAFRFNERDDIRRGLVSFRGRSYTTRFVFPSMERPTWENCNSMSQQPTNETHNDDSRLGIGHLVEERVLVLDFGSQYAQLIARRIREQNVYCEIVRHDLSAETVAARKPIAIILSGGPASVYADGPQNATRSCSTSVSRCSASATECS